jgi:hypothetical protein
MLLLQRYVAEIEDEGREDGTAAPRRDRTRDREQGVADDELADAERMAWLDEAAHPKCRFCGAGLNDSNRTGVCSTKPECRKQAPGRGEGERAPGSETDRRGGSAMPDAELSELPWWCTALAALALLCSLPGAGRTS